MKDMHSRMQGIPGAYPRSMYRCSGYTDEELRRPIEEWWSRGSDFWEKVEDP